MQVRISPPHSLTTVGVTCSLFPASRIAAARGGNAMNRTISPAKSRISAAASTPVRSPPVPSPLCFCRAAALFRVVSFTCSNPNRSAPSGFKGLFEESARIPSKSANPDIASPVCASGLRLEKKTVSPFRLEYGCTS
jgi:hypothetical protein